MKKIVIPSIICFTGLFITTSVSAQVTEDTTKVKKAKVELKANTKDSTQHKITVNEDGVKPKRKFKKSKIETTKPEERNPVVKKEE